jgi:hypothetical protein
MAANRYAEMVRWMAWPRIKNSRSSAQPGTHPHDGVQATVNPAPDAEPPPGSGQNTGVSGTTHAVAYEGGPDAPGAAAAAAGPGPAPSRRLRPIRYGHSTDDQVPASQPPAAPPPTTPASTTPASTAPPPTVPAAHGIAPPAEPYATPAPAPASAPADPVLSGTVVPAPGPADDLDDLDDYAGTAGLVYEAQPAYREPAYPSEEPVPNEGLGIFGGVTTTEVPEDAVPTREFEHQPIFAAPEPGRPRPAGDTSWNEPAAPPPAVTGAAEDSGAEDRKPGPFGRIRGIRPGGQPADGGEPRVHVRELPPDVQLRFIRDRVIIVVAVGAVSFILWRYWPVSVTLAIVAWVLDTMRRSRSAALYVNGGAHPGARKATTRQLRKMRRDGYFSLDARPIPDSREFIDHLVIGPTGVYAIDSEKWNPKLPIRTWNNKKLYHGPESQKNRLEHAVWEASQASEILSGALGIEIKVRPALAIYGPKIPWNVATIRNVDVFTGPALRKYLKGRGRMKDGVERLTREEVRTIYDTAARVLPDVAQSHARVG